MADFTSGFWSPFIAIATLLSIFACLALLVVNSRKPAPTPDNTTGHVWDGDLREANNPLPLWWSGLFVITIVFSLGYLWIYPGLGAFAGSAGWSQAGQYDAERQQLNAQMAPVYEKFLAQPVALLVGEPHARAVGERIFLNNCAQCHGSTGQGSKGFPNLADNDWLWGNSPEQVIESIAKGRTGVMPPMGSIVGGSVEVEQLAHYVLSLSGTAPDPLKASLGRSRYTVCAACHGARGEGNQALGAPNLTDRIWLHGGGLQSVIAIINNGKNNMMPGWDDKLTEGQIHVLAAYVLGLSQSGTGAAGKVLPLPAPPAPEKSVAAPTDRQLATSPQGAVAAPSDKVLAVPAAASTGAVPTATPVAIPAASPADPVPAASPAVAVPAATAPSDAGAAAPSGSPPARTAP
jgi:cytochrome c oxidase cbb3-type subunit III